jgi:hypothetical protein
VWRIVNISPGKLRTPEALSVVNWSDTSVVEQYFYCRTLNSEYSATVIQGDELWVAFMRKNTHSYSILVRKSAGKNPLGVDVRETLKGILK